MVGLEDGPRWSGVEGSVTVVEMLWFLWSEGGTGASVCLLSDAPPTWVVRWWLGLRDTRISK